MKKLFICSLFIVHCSLANAFEYNDGNATYKLTGYGTLGGMLATDINPAIIGDFSVRGQANYRLRDNISIGAMVSTDYVEFYNDNYLKDAFVYIENPNIGRIEFGQTEGVASKLGLGLPDVGGLRVNDYPIVFQEIDPDGTLLSKPVNSGTRHSLHLNTVSRGGQPWQYGASIAAYGSTFDWAADVGAKYKKSHGKTKIAVSMGASFIDNLDNYNSDIYGPRVNADWRINGNAGLNIQYNSWNVGITGRVVYDENPIGTPGDGVSAGVGASYDILKFSISLSYILSYTGFFHDGDTYFNRTGILSGRYKFNEWFDLWLSGGATGTDSAHPFISGGARVTF